MKRFAKPITLLLLVLALLAAPLACAETSGAVQGEGSGRGQAGAAVQEHASDAEYPAAPSAEAFAEGFFGVLAGLETGTAGASLKMAGAACEVCAFAAAHALYNPDVAAMRANMLTAFEAMGEDDQALFWESFEAVRALLDDSLEDYEANRALFEDAGVADAMDGMLCDPLNRLAWENLRDQTLTLDSDMKAD